MISYYICVLLILLYVSSATQVLYKCLPYVYAACVELLYVSSATIYVSSYYYICVLSNAGTV
jgi:hypothetical protein